MIKQSILRGMLVVCLASPVWADAPDAARISRAGLLDKIRGAWAGQMIDYEKIPAAARAEVATIANRKFAFTDYPFNEIVTSTERRAHQVIVKAVVHVDGRKSDLPADAYIAPQTTDDDLWHIHGLPPGEHTVRLVTTGLAHPGSKGRRVIIGKAVVYQDN